MALGSKPKSSEDWNNAGRHHLPTHPLTAHLNASCWNRLRDVCLRASPSSPQSSKWELLLVFPKSGNQASQRADLGRVDAGRICSQSWLMGRKKHRLFTAFYTS